MVEKPTKVQLKWPNWYHPDAPLGSAVKYIASLSGKFTWVGIYILKGNHLELGPFVGTPKAQFELVVPIRDKRGKVLGQIDLGSHTSGAFGAEEEEEVKKIAQEIGTFCSRGDFDSRQRNESKREKK